MLMLRNDLQWFLFCCFKFNELIFKTNSQIGEKFCKSSKKLSRISKNPQELGQVYWESKRISQKFVSFG